MTSSFQALVRPALCAALGLTLGCPGDKITGPAVATVSVTFEKSEIFVGENITGTAALLDASGAALSGRSVTWSSSAPTVATVNSASGIVTGLAAGSTTITATSEGKTGSATLTVLAPVSTVTVSLASSSIAIGATTQATAVLKDATGGTLTGRTVTWTSGTTSVATVSASGVVTAVDAGTSVITASSETKTGSATITVVPNPPAAPSLSGPANRSSGAGTTPTFSWSPASGASSYTLEVATSSSFGASNVINQAGITATSFTPTAALGVGIVYFWRVTAVNSGGSTVAANAPYEFSAPIPAGPSPGEVAVTPDGARALVVNTVAAGTVSIVSLVSRSISGSVTVGASPRGIAIRGDGAQAVITNGNSVSVLSLATNAVTQTIPMSCAGTTLYDIQYTPDGTRAVLPDLSAGCTQTGMKTITLSTGAQSFLQVSGTGEGIAVMPNGQSAILTGGVVGTSVKRVNLSTNAVTTISGTSSTFSAAVLPDNTAAIVTSGPGESVKRIDLASNTVSTIAAFGSNQYWRNIAITPDGTRAVVVADFTSAVISLTANSILATFPNGGRAVAITPDGKLGLITDGGSSGVLRVIRIP